MSLVATYSALPPLPKATADHASLADKQLLARFFRRREDAAFAALVQRHGPLVYRVCRRVLPDGNDADEGRTCEDVGQVVVAQEILVERDAEQDQQRKRQQGPDRLEIEAECPLGFYRNIRR